jgi:hypothetical protein
MRQDAWQRHRVCWCGQHYEDTLLVRIMPGCLTDAGQHSAARHQWPE